jgi:uncharacterized protein YdaU (DUF1376 family)
VVVIGYFSYKTKRIVSRRVTREILREREEDAPKAMEGDVSKEGRFQ